MQNNKQLWLGVLGATLLIPNAAFADISGKVFRDFNANGVFDTDANLNEMGFAGATVKAFDATGTQVTTTTSGVDGSYTLTGLTSGADYRIEFSWAESWLKPGTAGGTVAQFVKDSSTNINVAVNNPADYCQANPKLASPVYVNGNATSATAAMFSLDYDGAAKATIAKQSDIGSTWGLAYQRETGKLYAAGVIKRHAGLGSLGLGGIYVFNSPNGAGDAVPFVDLDVAPFNLNFGTLGDNAARGLPAGLTTMNHDASAYSAVGMQGIGDIDLSEDGKTLWVTNLNAVKNNLGSLVKLDVTKGVAPTSATEYPLADMSGLPTCTGGVLRPWALKFYQGKGYLGAVCSAETSKSRADLQAFVLSFDPNAPTSVAVELNVPLNYAKGAVNTTTFAPVGNQWNPWSNNPADFFVGSNFYGKPVPVLTDLDFDESGSMVLGFMDRHGMQLGAYNLMLTGSDLIVYQQGGDLLRACPDAAGIFQLESAGKCGGATGFSTNNNKGPGGGEFYNDNIPIAPINHEEMPYGGLAIKPGSGEVVWAGMDPVAYNSGGLFWSKNANGSRVRVTELWRGMQGGTDGIGTPNGFSGKTVGMGDLEVLCDPAPIEVGDRVWLDKDGDGLQDADESGIDGVAVKLVCGADEATVTTSNGGQFLFTNKAGGNAAFMEYGESCVLKVDSTQTPVKDYKLTAANADGVTSNNALTDLRDADAVDNAGTAEIAFTAGGIGENNHSLDIGYKSAPVITFDPPPGPDAFSCAANVRLATSVQVNGDSQAAGSTGAGVNGLITFDYAATGELAAPFSKATAGQVGSVWGLSYDVSSKKLYAAAFLKRHASFGPNGIGAIYQMDGTSATPTPSLLIDLVANGVDVGTSSRVASSGAVDDPNELPADASQPSWDRDAFAQIGKISLGDIDISADGKTLWAVNLKQRELVEINLTNTTVTAKHAITDPGCSNGEFRPWAVKVHDGKVWVGTVCSAETSQQAADLKAYVQAFDGTTFTTATSFALNYSKGSIGNGPGDEKWQPWKDTFTTLASGDFAIYPQPILSDIEFDMDGSLILGFMDRMGHQVGGVNYTPNYPDDDTMIQGQTGGDIIRVCNNGGKYELENNATCSSGSTTGKDNGQGPGNGEYYWGEMWDFNPFNADGGYHQETSFGGLAFKAGSGEIAVTAMNPLNPNANAGGVIWLDNATGGRAANAGVQVYRQQDGTSPYFGKASGMGDVELFCAEAALQPDVSLTKVVDKPTAKRGETVIYTLTLSNTGTGAATGVSVTDSLPAGVVYVSDDGSGAYVASSGVWSVGSLAANTAKTLKITVTVK